MTRVRIPAAACMKKPKQNRVQDLALERIYRLFEQAEEEFVQHPGRSKRYVEMARNLSKRNKATIPRELKNRFCKKCGIYWKEGKNATHTVQGEMRTITCKECGFIRKTKVK